MAHVITDACIDIKDRACVACCPVDCIYEGTRTLYIHPEECIDCGICVSVCPVQAIYEEGRLPPSLMEYATIGREFFGSSVSGLGAPGGAAGIAPCDQDHPAVERVPFGKGRR